MNNIDYIPMSQYFYMKLQLISQFHYHLTIQVSKYRYKVYNEIETFWCWTRNTVMMTSSNGNIYHITGPLCGEFTGEFPSQKPVTWSFDFFSCICNWANDSRCHRAHYDVTVILRENMINAVAADALWLLASAGHQQNDIGYAR